MRRFIIILLVFILGDVLWGGEAHANNIRVENVSLYKSADQPAGTIDIKFDVIWDNPVSGTDGNSAAFFDRAWIFVKFWDSTVMYQATQPWGHAILTTGGSLSTYSATTNTGISADGIGAFASPGTGQTVRWNYAASPIPNTDPVAYVASTDTVKVRVMGIEMVYIPTGAYELGDGATTESTNAFHVTDNTKVGTIGTTLVQHIKVDANGYDDDVIEGVVGSNTGIGIKGDGGIDYSVPEDGVIDNASFPTGYNAFYIMKYEVSQNQYRDFLNTLSRAAQDRRTYTSLAEGTTSVTNRYVMAGTSIAANIASTSNYRNGIRCDATIHTSNAITFYCDYNDNGTPNESDDGEWIACNYLTWMDLAAFADWAGLRPMTELEFEKACRGGGVTDSVTGVRAWGNTTDETATTSLTDSGKISETPNQGNCNYSSCSPDGPYRCGSYSDSTSTRQNAGASYYGLMDMSGSLWERPVTVGNTGANGGGGRLFTGTHGDGVLTGSEVTATYQGNATNIDWPGINATAARGVHDGATGSGFRGGSWDIGAAGARVSDRGGAALACTGRSSGYGGRLARTSP